MRRLNHGVFWAIFLVIAGVFLLLKNLNLLGPWGEFAWGALFTAVGAGFLIAFLASVASWWLAIPAFTLLGLGVPMLLAQLQRFNFGAWQGPVALLGIALGFWVVLFVRAENWWAEIPAGIFTLLGLMLGFQDRIRPDAWLAVFAIGLGLVFALLYLLRRRQAGGWWPAIPAASLILFGLVTWMGPAGTTQTVVRWWPALLIPAGLLLLLFSLQRLPASTRARTAAPRRGGPAIPAPGYETIPAASGSSVTQHIPDAELPPATAPEPAAAATRPVDAGEGGAGGEPDIYEFLKGQPPEVPDEPRSG